MEYEELCKHIKNLEKNRDLAFSRGETHKGKRYQHTINIEMQKKKEMERDLPAESLGTLESTIKKLEAENESLKQKNKELLDKFESVNERINMILNPELYKKVEEEPEPELTECPNCHKKFADMTEHQKVCIKSGGKVEKEPEPEPEAEPEPEVVEAVEAKIEELEVESKPEPEPEEEEGSNGEGTV